MDKNKSIYEFQQVTWDKLYVRLNEDLCNISYINFSHEVDEDWTPEGYGSNSVSIPVRFLPKLKEGIDKALTMLEKRYLDNDD